MPLYDNFLCALFALCFVAHCCSAVPMSPPMASAYGSLLRSKQFAQQNEPAAVPAFARPEIREPSVLMSDSFAALPRNWFFPPASFEESEDLSMENEPLIRLGAKRMAKSQSFGENQRPHPRSYTGGQGRTLQKLNAPYSFFRLMG